MKKLMIVASALAMAGCYEFDGLERTFDTMPKMRIWGNTKFSGHETAVLYTIRGAGGLTLEVGARRGRTPFCVRVCDV